MRQAWEPLPLSLPVPCLTTWTHRVSARWCWAAPKHCSGRHADAPCSTISYCSSTYSSGSFLGDPTAPLAQETLWRSSDCFEMLVTQARRPLVLVGTRWDAETLVPVRLRRPLSQPLASLVISCPSGDGFRSMSSCASRASGAPGPLQVLHFLMVHLTIIVSHSSLVPAAV